MRLFLKHSYCLSKCLDNGSYFLKLLSRTVKLLLCGELYWLGEEGNSHIFFKYCNSDLDRRKHMELAFKDLCSTSSKRLDLLITSGLTEFSALFGECTYSLY